MAKRDAVEATANLHNRGRLIRVGDREARRNSLGAFDEQGDRGRVDSRADVQRGHRPQLLVGDTQSLAASGQNRHGRRLREDRLDQIGCRLEDVLAIVEHQ